MVDLNLAGAAILALLAVVPMAQSSETIVLETTPVSDGSIWETKTVWENTPDKVVDTEMIALVGSFYGNQAMGIMEFSLPPADKISGKTLRSAKLMTAINSTDEAPSPGTVSHIDVDIYGYTGETANGVVDLEDWSAGEKLGRWLEKDVTVIGDGQKMPEFDVTKCVQAALAAKKPFAGFRFQADGIDKSELKTLILRTAEFGAENGACYTPKLVLEFD